MFCIRCAKAQQEIEAANQRILALEAELSVAQVQVRELAKLTELQTAEIERIKRQAAGTKEVHQPERVSPDQLQLAFERVMAAITDKPLMESLSAANAEAAPTPSTNDDAQAERKQPRRGRRKLWEMPLAVIEERIVPPEVLACGGEGWERVSEETSDRLALRPARFVRLRTVREIWVRITESGKWIGDTLVTAPLPGWAFPGVMAEASVIADIAMKKYGYSLPLNRQEKMTTYEGFGIARSTMSDWMELGDKTLSPIVSAMRSESLAESFCIATDATSAPVRARGGRLYYHLFVFIADVGHITFAPARHHRSQSIVNLLPGFRGRLLSDASSIYDALYALGVIAVACWAHARRYFWKATMTESSLAYEGLSLIDRIFAIARKAKRLSLEERGPYRALHAGPIVTTLDQWVEQARPKAEPRGRLAAALTYYTNQREALGRFLDDGRLEVDNNASERELRNLVVGRHNWQHFETKAGLQWYATYRSLISSAVLHKLNPHRYLEQSLRLAPHWPKERYIELAPKNWRSTFDGLDDRLREIADPAWQYRDPAPPITRRCA